MPPQHSTDPRQHLHSIKGLGNIIVGAQIESGNLIAVLTLSSQQNDRQRAASLPQLGQDGQTIHNRHHDIQKDEVRFLFGEQLQRLMAVFRLQRPVTRSAERNSQRSSDFFLVITD